MKNIKNSNTTNVLPFKKAATPEPAQSGSQNLPSAKRLVEALESRGRELGQDITQVANKINVTYGFLTQLKSGLRPATTLSDDFTEACAKYLELSRFQVLLLAGRITVYDMFPSPQSPARKQSLDAVCANGELHDALATLSAMEQAIAQRRKP